VNGELRTALHFYLRSRVQRWFFALAILSLAARMLLLRMPCCSRPTSFWYFISVLPALGFASASLMSSAAVFRTVSSLRTVYLIPRSRTRLVLGLVLAQVFVAALVTVLVVALGAAAARPLAWGSARGTFEYTFGIATLAVVALQVIAGPSRVASVLVGTLLLALLARVDVFMQAEIGGVPTPHVLTVLALAAWLPFAAWYRHTGPIAPAAATWRAWPRAAVGRSASAPASRSDALAAYLLDQASLWLACRRQLFFWLLYNCGMLGALVAMLWSPFFHSRHPPHRDFSAVPLILLFAISFATNTIAGCMARHSRALWLPSGDSRRVLFETAERLAWRALTLLGAPFLLIATAEWHFLPHLEMDAAYPVAVYLTIAPCGLYSGLLNFTRTADFRFVVFFLIVAQGGVTAAVLRSATAGNSYGGVPSGFWILPLGLALLAVVLRRMAQRRWLTIDWLRYRAPRPGTMGLRTAE
jgi:hypothetical protein